MACIQTVVAPLSVDPVALSGYTRITQFTFQPLLTGDFQDKFHKKVSSSTAVYDFGDGTVVSADAGYTARHIYNYPGVYETSLFLYAEDGGALIDTLTESISVENFVKTSIEIGNESTLIRSGVLDPEDNLFRIDISTTWQDYNSTGNTVLFSSSGSKTKPFNENIKYSHLLPFNSFYVFDNGVFNRVKNVELDLTPEYYVLSARDDNTKVPILTTQETTGSKLLGAKGEFDLYYFDDLPSDEIQISCGLELAHHKLQDQYVNDIDSFHLADRSYFEVPTQVVSITSLSTLPTKISFTSTGMKSMSVHSYKRQNSKFQVFAAPADDDNNIIKYYPQIVSSGNVANLNEGYVKFVSSGTTTTLSTVCSLSSKYLPYDTTLNQSYLSSYLYAVIDPISAGTFTLSADMKLDNVTINNSIISGVQTITVWPASGEYVIYKVNEDNDYQETLKSYRFQSFLHEYDKFFDGTLGQIVGTLSSRPTTYGKVINERIANFAMNVSDPDVCTYENIVNFGQLLDQEVENIQFLFPPNVKRLFNLFSSKLSKLVGAQERFQESFDCLFSENTAYARNVDLESPFTTVQYEVTAGTNFVARQKFDNRFLLIKPMEIAAKHCSTANTGTSTQYALSTFNNFGSTWGWSLDNSLTGVELDSMYQFYPYLSGIYNLTHSNNLVDYSNPHNTLTKNQTALSAWTHSGGIIYENYDYQLRQGLNI